MPELRLNCITSARDLQKYSLCLNATVVAIGPVDRIRGASLHRVLPGLGILQVGLTYSSSTEGVVLWISFHGTNRDSPTKLP